MPKIEANIKMGDVRKKFVIERDTIEEIVEVAIENGLVRPADTVVSLVEFAIAKIGYQLKGLPLTKGYKESKKKKDAGIKSEEL